MIRDDRLRRRVRYGFAVTVTALVVVYIILSQRELNNADLLLWVELVLVILGTWLIRKPKKTRTNV